MPHVLLLLYVVVLLSVLAVGGKYFAPQLYLIFVTAPLALLPRVQEHKLALFLIVLFLVGVVMLVRRIERSKSTSLHMRDNPPPFEQDNELTDIQKKARATATRVYDI